MEKDTHKDSVYEVEPGEVRTEHEVDDKFSVIPTTFPIVCLGPTLMLKFPPPSLKVNCGWTYTGRATLLERGMGIDGGQE